MTEQRGDPRSDVWNLLHDGEITQLLKHLPGDLDVCVDIPYLAKYFNGNGKDVWVRLHKCRRFDVQLQTRNGDEIISDLSRLAAARICILGADETADPVSVDVLLYNENGAAGALFAEFASLSIRLDDGADVSIQELDKATSRYWSDWRRINEMKRSRSN